MSAFAADWLNILLRWAHLVAGIGWIGTSFYFIALDLSLRKRERMNPGVAGTAWEVHGGGFYHVEKYTVAPATLPTDLVWFKWEAYLTWVTGFALLAVQYYWQASTYLIDRSVMAMAPGEAIVISVATLTAGWFLYDRLCRSWVGARPVLLAAAVFVMIVGSAWLYGQVFSGRGAFIHVASLVGTIMAANVFAVIIPNQKKITASLLAGREPDPALGRIGKQRSVHNNYLTLPVLVLMVSNHYPVLTNHPEGWLVVALILVMGGSARHLLNRHDAGDPFRAFAWTLPVGIVALVAAILLTAPQSRSLEGAGTTGDDRALTIAQTHCASCHASSPSHAGFNEAPKGVVLTSLDDLRRYAEAIRRQTVDTDAMPLGNETGMTEQERIELGAWIEALEGH